jgi:hypothetical protein
MDSKGQAQLRTVIGDRNDPNNSADAAPGPATNTSLQHAGP